MSNNVCTVFLSILTAFPSVSGSHRDILSGNLYSRSFIEDPSLRLDIIESCVYRNFDGQVLRREEDPSGQTFSFFSYPSSIITFYIKDTLVWLSLCKERISLVIKQLIF